MMKKRSVFLCLVVFFVVAMNLSSCSNDEKKTPFFNDGELKYDGNVNITLLNETKQRITVALEINGSCIFEGVLPSAGMLSSASIITELPAGKSNISIKIPRGREPTKHKISINERQKYFILFQIRSINNKGEIKYNFKSSKKPFAYI